MESVVWGGEGKEETRNKKREKGREEMQGHS